MFRPERLLTSFSCSLDVQPGPDAGADAIGHGVDQLQAGHAGPHHAAALPPAGAVPRHLGLKNRIPVSLPANVTLVRVFINLI